MHHFLLHASRKSRSSTALNLTARSESPAAGTSVDGHQSQPRLSNKAKRQSKYCAKYQKIWPFIKPVKQDIHRAYCAVCETDISIGSGGKHDISRHVSTEKHIGMMAQLERVGYVNKTSGLRANRVAAAEALFCQMIADYNLPLTVADAFTEIVPKMFPDSQVAKDFSCKRRKATVIITEALAPEVLQRTVRMAKANPVALMVEESNEQHDDKTCAVLLKCINEDTLVIENRLLGMPVCNCANGQDLFNAINDTMRNLSIPWSQVKAYSSDNANTMVERSNSVLSRVRHVAPGVIDIGCISHIANLCANALVKALDVEVDSLLVDTYYWFHHSSKRKDFKEFQTFNETKMEVILKHVETRWLSLERCVKLILSQWEALKSYFSSIPEADLKERDKDKPSTRPQRCRLWYNSEETKITLHFLVYALNRLNSFNTLFQAEGCFILHLLDQTKDVLHTYLARFVKPAVIREHPDVTEILFEDPKNHLPNEEIDIGSEARACLNTIRKDCDPEMIQNFYSCVKKGYVAAVKKLQQCFPFKNPVLSEIKLLDPACRDIFSDEQVVAMADRYLGDISSDLDRIDRLLEEWRKYKAAADLPTIENSQIDSWWLHLLQSKDYMGKLRYNEFGQLIKVLLIMPCDQAPVKRVFSEMTKTSTKFRPTISNETVTALIICKNNNESCQNMTLSSDLLKSVMTATGKRKQVLQEIKEERDVIDLENEKEDITDSKPQSPRKRTFPEEFTMDFDSDE